MPQQPAGESSKALSPEAGTTRYLNSISHNFAFVNGNVPVHINLTIHRSDAKYLLSAEAFLER